MLGVCEVVRTDMLIFSEKGIFLEISNRTSNSKTDQERQEVGGYFLYGIAVVICFPTSSETAGYCG